MICKVKPYQSAKYRDIWYNQGDEFEAKSLEDVSDIIEKIDIIEETTKNEEA